jgi:hypothetical protein
MKRNMLVVATLVGVAALVGAGVLFSAAQSDYDAATEAHEEYDEAVARRKAVEKRERSVKARYDETANRGAHLEDVLNELAMAAQVVVETDGSFNGASNALIDAVNEVADGGLNRPVAHQAALLSELDLSLSHVRSSVEALHDAYAALGETP